LCNEIYTTEAELAQLAGTDKDGTTMYGLVHAAQVKGLNATGMILPVDQLKLGYMVLLTVGGLYHFSVITSINGTTGISQGIAWAIWEAVDAIGPTELPEDGNNTTNTTN